MWGWCIYILWIFVFVCNVMIHSSINISTTSQIFPVYVFINLPKWEYFQFQIFRMLLTLRNLISTSLPLTTKTYLPNIWQLPIFQIFSSVLEGKMKFIDISCRYTPVACIWKISRYTANSSGFGPLLVIFYPVWCLQVLN